MSIFVWVMMGIAIWHFTIFLPDKFWGGIVGAFLAAIVGSAVIGFVINGLQVAGRNDLELVHALQAIPGSIVGLAICWWYGRYREEHPKRKRRPSGTARARA